jgi:hypothetical protein
LSSWSRGDGNGEPLGQRMLHGIGRGLAFIPSFSIPATAIGHAMLQATFEGRREGTLDNRAMRELAQRYAARS